MMRERLPTRPALVTSRRGARTLKNTRSECTACKMLNTCSVAGECCQFRPLCSSSSPALSHALHDALFCWQTDSEGVSEIHQA